MAAQVASVLDEIQKTLDARRDIVPAVYKTMARMTVDLAVSIGTSPVNCFSVTVKY